MSQASQSLLFTPTKLRDVSLRNRIVLSPMCTYSAEDGMASDWHTMHLGQFALGGAGVVFTEVTAVTEQGRITYGDLGIYSNEHVAPLARVAKALRSLGAVPAIQLGHSGRKGSSQRPWHGMEAITAADERARGERPWWTVAPVAEAMAEGWHVPQALSVEDIRTLVRAWRDAARRAVDAGFDIVEVHCAHGYLGHQFLSPLINKRNDAYGGDRSGRMRFPLEVAEAVRAEWPKDKPVFVRISSVDGVDGGWTIEDSVAFARELKLRGIDAVDCSSGGVVGSATARAVPRGLGFQVPFAEKIRREAGIATVAVGLILTGPQAEQILQNGQADLIAVAREALYDPYWPRHAARQLGADNGDYSTWPSQYGWWLDKREPHLRRIRGQQQPQSETLNPNARAHAVTGRGGNVPSDRD
jgi:2,4-dienoyl-CoA reductase-like NADH-dependent reductase (Old Yellow Enzyme family)